MSSALYALAGTVIGVLGTVLVDVVRGRREERGRSHEALRTVSADFTAQIARVRRYSFQVRAEPGNQGTWQMLETEFSEARASYERLLLTSESTVTQEASRRVVHFTYHMAYAARVQQAETFRQCETEMMNWSAKLYTEIRRELGLKNPANVYKDPPGGFPIPGRPAEGTSS